MPKERYFLESHLRWNELPQIRQGFEDNGEHLHVTFVRPFSIDSDDTQKIKEEVIKYCRGRQPISFVLEGKGSFDENTSFIPVKSEELQSFDNGLEKLLDRMVVFETKLNDEKILHLTVGSETAPLSRTEMAMLRLTCIRNLKDGSGKRIWFSYDFVTQEVLNREETRDSDRWQETQKQYTKIDNI